MVDSVISRVYTGTKQPSPEDYKRYGLQPYLPSESLIEAVNLTIFLQKRPLLLKGDPGCGKTRLAQAVADEFYPMNLGTSSLQLRQEMDSTLTMQSVVSTMLNWHVLMRNNVPKLNRHLQNRNLCYNKI